MIKIKLTKMMIFVFDRVENTVGKGENAGYHHFLLFPQCFLCYLRQQLSFKQCYICRLQMLSNLVEAKILLSGKEFYHARHNSEFIKSILSYNWQYHKVDWSIGMQKLKKN